MSPDENERSKDGGSGNAGQGENGRWRRAGRPPERGRGGADDRDQARSNNRRGDDRGEAAGRRGDGPGKDVRRAPGRRGGRGERDERSRSSSPDRDRGASERRGPRSWDRSGSTSDSGGRRDPEIPDGITGRELDRSVWHELRTLSKENAEGVAQHLVASAVALEIDTELALSHAQTAARRAGRVPAVREAVGLVHYRRGEFNDGLREFRTARRLSGSNHLLPYMVDCERGLGRLQRALDLAASPEAKTLAEDDNIELAIVVSGVRRDLGQPDAALMGLRLPALKRAKQQPWAARLLYAYAEALLASGDEDGAQDWFARAVEADQTQETDAAERLGELQGVSIEDLGPEEDLETEQGDLGAPIKPADRPE